MGVGGAVSKPSIKAYAVGTAKVADFYLEYDGGSLFVGRATNSSWRNELNGKGGKRKSYDANVLALRSSLAETFAGLQEQCK
jgi:hypothetical protein